MVRGLLFELRFRSDTDSEICFKNRKNGYRLIMVLIFLFGNRDN
jgi:hypothetical protein